MSFNEYPYTNFHEMNLDWVIKKVKELAAAWAQVQQDWTDEQAAFANLQSWIENYFNNLNVQTEINVKLDAMVAAGTMSELIAPYVASGLPAEVASQIGDVVAAQIGPVVAAQISAVVADQLPAVAATAAAQEVSAWLALHVNPETGYVIDDTFTVQGAAADAKAVGDEFTSLKSALSKEIRTVIRKNLFDKTKAISGYIKTDGTIGSNASYITSDYIEISESTLTFSGVQTAGSGVATYDANGDFIERVDMTDVHGETMTFGSSVKSIRFSTQAVTEDTAMVEYGSHASPYEPYSEYYEFTHVKNEGTPYTLEVSWDGSKDYKTIASAVARALELESASTPVTILIYGGVYEEVINLIGATHYISFVGVNKKDVIWVDNSGAYSNSPLHYASGGLIKGITFLATHDDDPDFIQYMIDHDPVNFGSYALHLDDTTYSADDAAYELRVEDCICISKHNAACGVGMRPNETIVFKNCEFRTDLPTELSALSNSKKGAFLVHDASHLATSVPQNCFIDNCRFHKNVSFALGLVPPTITGAMTLYFYNNILWSDERGKADNVVNGAANANIHNSSSCNNVSALNK